ncbi:hypothetical protein KCU67_g43, partial [Aureobasidium melanogenum]
LSRLWRSKRVQQGCRSEETFLTRKICRISRSCKAHRSRLTRASENMREVGQASFVYPSVISEALLSSSAKICGNSSWYRLSALSEAPISRIFSTQASPLSLMSSMLDLEVSQPSSCCVHPFLERDCDSCIRRVINIFRHRARLCLESEAARGRSETNQSPVIAQRRATYPDWHQIQPTYSCLGSLHLFRSGQCPDRREIPNTRRGRHLEISSLPGKRDAHRVLRMTCHQCRVSRKPDGTSDPRDGTCDYINMRPSGLEHADHNRCKTVAAGHELTDVVRKSLVVKIVNAVRELIDGLSKDWSIHNGGFKEGFDTGSRREWRMMNDRSRCYTIPYAPVRLGVWEHLVKWLRVVWNR